MRLLLLLVALSLSAAASGQQYRWVDKDGRVRYGDVPPAGVKATPLRPAPAPAAPPAAKPAAEGKAPLSAEEAFRKRQEEKRATEEKAEKERAEAAAKRQNCEQAKAHLRSLESGQRIRRVNEKGEFYFIDDAERAKEAGQARQAVSEFCG